MLNLWLRKTQLKKTEGLRPSGEQIFCPAERLPIALISLATENSAQLGSNFFHFSQTSLHPMLSLLKSMDMSHGYLTLLSTRLIPSLD